MTELFQFVTNWKVLLVLAVIWSFAAYVNAMDAPDKFSPRWYRKWYKVSHYFVGQLTRAGVVKELPRISTGTIVDQESPFRRRT